MCSFIINTALFRTFCDVLLWCYFVIEIQHKRNKRMVMASTPVLSPVSIQTQLLALRALRKRKPQETQALFTQQTQVPANRNARSKQWQP